MQFLADESCDFAGVLALARSEARILLTEDKDFGMLAYAGGHETGGGTQEAMPCRE